MGETKSYEPRPYCRLAQTHRSRRTRRFAFKAGSSENMHKKNLGLGENNQFGIDLFGFCSSVKKPNLTEETPSSRGKHSCPEVKWVMKNPFRSANSSDCTQLRWQGSFYNAIMISASCCHISFPHMNSSVLFIYIYIYILTWQGLFSIA